MIDPYKCVSMLITSIGDDVERTGLQGTPLRVVKSFSELYKGYNSDPKDHIKYFPSTSNEMVIVKNLQVFSMCEHHMLPFVGVCHVGYIPNGTVLGLSKFSRILNCFARRLQIQEQLTHDMGKFLTLNIPNNMGVSVVIEAQHMCMRMRGCNEQESTAITSYVSGFFKEYSETKSEFMSMIKS